MHVCSHVRACILRALMHISTHIGVCVCVCVCAPSHINCAECDISLLFLTLSVLLTLRPPLRSSRNRAGQLRRRLCARRNYFLFAVRGALGQRGCRAVWRRLVCCVRACVRVCQRWETGREEGRGGGEKEMSMRACACVWTCIINLLHIRLGCIAGAIIGGLVGVVSFASVIFYCHRSVEV